jgi:hypothetical protein
MGDSLTRYSYNLKNGKGKVIGAPILKVLSKENYPSFAWTDISTYGANSSLITRFGVLPIIFKYDLKNNENKVYVLKSKFHTNLTTPWDGKSNKNYEYLKGRYWQVLYDPYRHLYYSVYSLEIPPIDEKTGEVNDLDDKPMSIILADTLFRYRGEVLLEKRKYFRSLFVGKEGLYVSTANNHNIDEKEDLMRFQLFKIKNL